MNIERKEYLIADGIGEVKFIGTNYIVSMMIDDGKMRIGTMECLIAGARLLTMPC